MAAGFRALGAGLLAGLGRTGRAANPFLAIRTGLTMGTNPSIQTPPPEVEEALRNPLGYAPPADPLPPARATTRP